jgi:hypothetical protein
MTHPDILIEIDRETETRWITYGENHYPFQEKGGRETYAEQDPGRLVHYGTDNEGYWEFKFWK